MTSGHAPAPPPTVRPPKLRWWKEAIYVVAFYAVYSFIRNTFGSAAVEPQDAFDNAELIIDVERSMGLFVEQAVQDAFIAWDWFIRAWNIFYGTFHFVVTTVALVLLFRRMPGRYRRWRTTLACTTALALIGFATFPLMPPRLLPTIDSSYDFIDTLQSVGGLWSFSSGAMEDISNQYAAMPSLHFGWALWSTLVLWPMVRRRWVQALVIVYPLCTLFSIVVTANHYWIDAAAGALVLGVGYLMASAWVDWLAPDPVMAPASLTSPSPDVVGGDGSVEEMSPAGPDDNEARPGRTHAR